MRIAISGLGRMGANMARRLRRGGIEVVGLNRTQSVVDELAAEVGVIAQLLLRRDVGCATRTIEQESGMLVRVIGAHGAPYVRCFFINEVHTIASEAKHESFLVKD